MENVEELLQKPELPESKIKVIKSYYENGGFHRIKLDYDLQYQLVKMGVRSICDRRLPIGITEEQAAKGLTWLRSKVKSMKKHGIPYEVIDAIEQTDKKVQLKLMYFHEHVPSVGWGHPHMVPAYGFFLDKKEKPEFVYCYSGTTGKFDRDFSVLES